MSNQLYIVKNEPILPLFWDNQDRGRNVLYGRRSDGVKVVKIGIGLPEAPKTYLNIRANGKEYEQEGHSLTRNYYKRIICHMAGIVSEANADTKFHNLSDAEASNNYIPCLVGALSGTSAYLLNATGLVQLVGYRGEAAVRYGATVGTGNTAYDFDDYELATPIAHGTGSGRLYHYEALYTTPSNDNNIWTALGKRYFDNINSDANDITVKEVGQITPLCPNSVVPSDYFLEERTVLDTPVVIPYRSSALLVYTRTLTLSNSLDDFTPNGNAALITNALSVVCSGASYGQYTRKLKDTGGNLVGSNCTHRHYLSKYVIFGASAGNITQGIVAGSGNTAVAWTDYILEDIYEDGNAAGQLEYAAQDTPSISYSADNKKWTAQQLRTLTNDSAGDQVVREIGLIAWYDYGTSYANSSYFLIQRTVLGSPITLSAGGDSLQIIYEFTITHP